MGLEFQAMEMNPVMINNNYSLRMTPLYHLILSKIAFKKRNGFIASKLEDKIDDLRGGEDVYAKDYAFGETGYIYISVKNVKKNELDLNDENTIYIVDEAGLGLIEKKLNENDIIMSRSGTVGISVLVTKDMVEDRVLIPSGYVKVIKVNKSELNPKFLVYYLNSPIINELLEVGATGKNQKNLPHSAVFDLPIPEISLEMQKGILSKIEIIENKINKLKQKIKTTIEIVDEVFSKELKINNGLKKDNTFFFNELKLTEVDGDRYIRIDPDYFYYITSYLNFLSANSHIKFIELKGMITFYETGKPIKRKDYSDIGTSYIHLVPRDIKDCEITLTEPIHLIYQKGEELREYRCSKGDVLLVLSSTVGDCAIFNLSDNNYTLSHYMARFNIKGINPKFLVYYLSTSPIKNYFRAIETGKDQKNLAQYYINHLKVPILENQEKIVKEIDEKLKEKVRMKKQVMKLKEDIDEIMWTELHKISKKQIEDDK